MQFAKPPSICAACRRLRVRLNPDYVEGWDLPTNIDIEYCEAFPERIPDDIAVTGYDHRNPYPGDKGIRFAPKTNIEPVLAAYEHLVPEAQRNRKIDGFDSTEPEN